MPEGEIQKGKAVFIRLSCNECHSISDIELDIGSDSLNIPLGGEVSTQKTYGGLVTSVINPSHKIAWKYTLKYKQNGSTGGELSKMKNYNEVMTVQELIDLVAFLKSEYKVVAPSENYYPYNYRLIIED